MRTRSLIVLAAASLLMLAVLPGNSERSTSLTSGSSTFTITSTIGHLAPGSRPPIRCSGTSAPLAPGVTRCLTYRVDNHLDAPITVRTITMSLDPNYPPPPSGCSPSALSLPEFSGALAVPGGGNALSPGLPIALMDTAYNQDNCKQTVLHFAFSGTALVAEPGGPLAVTGTEVLRQVLAAFALLVLGLAALSTGPRTRPGGKAAHE